MGSGPHGSLAGALGMSWRRVTHRFCLGRPGQGARVSPVRQGHTWAIQGVHGSDERDPTGVGKCQQHLQHPERSGRETEAQGRDRACSDVS